MDETGLQRIEANSAPLTPLAFLSRTAEVFPDATAIMHGTNTATWGEVDVRVRRLAAGLIARGVKPGDVVAVLSPNTPAFVEANFAVPMTGAVMLTLNTRLDPATVAYCLSHSEATMVLADVELLPRLHKAVESLDRRPKIVRIDDPLAPMP
ncbi:MAG: AMP-binding protein, partial [Pseudomonadota bacterium]